MPYTCLPISCNRFIAEGHAYHACLRMHALSAARGAAQVEGIARLAQLMREISASAAARTSQPQRAPAAAALPGYGLLPEQARASCRHWHRVVAGQLVRARAA